MGTAQDVLLILSERIRRGDVIKQPRKEGSSCLPVFSDSHTPAPQDQPTASQSIPPPGPHLVRLHSRVLGDDSCATARSIQQHSVKAPHHLGKGKVRQMLTSTSTTNFLRPVLKHSQSPRARYPEASGKTRGPPWGTGVHHSG